MTESSEIAETILEVLGNESRRRILSLLSKKPCYVSEISYSLKMAPKAVIEHLEKLEKAGIIKSFEEGRRRYYRINKNLRIEITIAPHMFETCVVTGINNMDIKKIVFDVGELLNFKFEKCGTIELSDTIRKIEKIQQNVSKLQVIINSKVNEMFEKITKEINSCIDSEIERIVMIGIAKGAKSAVEIAEQFGISYREVEKVLKKLEREKVLSRIETEEGTFWKLKIKNT
jgi:ArsR family transcriptional regulator